MWSVGSFPHGRALTRPPLLGLRGSCLLIFFNSFKSPTLAQCSFGANRRPKIPKVPESRQSKLSKELHTNSEMIIRLKLSKPNEILIPPNNTIQPRWIIEAPLLHPYTVEAHKLETQ